MSIHQHSGKKYLRKIYPADGQGQSILIDVYRILIAYEVTNPATAHTIKKILLAGKREKGGLLQDLQEAQDALTEAIKIEKNLIHEEEERIRKKEAGNKPADDRPAYLREALQRNMKPAEEDEGRV